MPKTAALSVASHPDGFLPVARILEKFEQLARDIGPRHVGMARLSAELGISTKTLYRYFPAKSDLVTALMRHRITGWQTMRDTQLAAKMPALQRIHRLAASWVTYVTSLSPDFWQQIARDFPEAQVLIDKEYADFMLQGGKNLIAIVRNGFDPGIALQALKLLIERAADVHYCQQMGLTPTAVLRQHIAIWAGGAVRQDHIVELEADQ